MKSNHDDDDDGDRKINVLMIGTGEYTTGYVDGGEADSDKGAGVVALSMFDLRRRGKVDRIAMCGVNGKKFAGIRAHLDRKIGRVYRRMDVSCDTFPSDDDGSKPDAYLDALDTFRRGDVAIVFTPDDTHHDIAVACITRGLHVLVTKPIVQTLAHHKNLARLARTHNVLVAVEVHKRLDPFYADARDRIRSDALGTNFSYFYSYMSQPKHQLRTFGAWAGSRRTDISYYLNSHHVDFTEWALHRRARPIRVTATSSTGVATTLLHHAHSTMEDSITLTVTWQNLRDTTNDKQSTSMACAVYTASWIAPKSDVHSQQRFFYMGSNGEITVDQAHRGCTLAMDNKPFASINPLFMKYTPSPDGRFVGQSGYGLASFENFIHACRSCNAGMAQPADFDNDNDSGGDGHQFDTMSIATVHTTMQGTAILEAGRRSLDADGQPMDILYDDDDDTSPTLDDHTGDEIAGKKVRYGLEPVDIRPHVFLKT